jgi:hypothetical protein
MNKVIITRWILASLLCSLISGVSISTASASCADFPESVTPDCVASNLAAAQASQAAYAAAQAAEAAAAAQRAIDNANAIAAQDKAQASADAVLPADSCARSTNRFNSNCVAASTAKALAENNARIAAEDAANAALPKDSCDRIENKSTTSCQQKTAEATKVLADAQMAAQLAEEVAKRKVWGIYDPALGDCSASPASLTSACIKQNLLAEKFRSAETSAKQAADAAAAKSAEVDVKALQAKIDAKNREILLAAAKAGTIAVMGPDGNLIASSPAEAKKIADVAAKKAAEVKAAALKAAKIAAAKKMVTKKALPTPKASPN